MSASERQTQLIVAEDWKKIYQSFRNADFQSYDFDNLRRTMINYLRQNYPEDFNDYIESSEFLSLIDMIAFLGQNLSFRIDLNARENFLDTAERRDSILKLSKMLAYNPHRNQPSNGLLRIETIKTTEKIKDSFGFNLSGSVIRWNDNNNTAFFEQFVKILNSAMSLNSNIGNPLKSAEINGVLTQKYRINSTSSESAVYPFSKSIDGIRTRFEIVSSDIQNDNIIEEPPIPGNSPSILFRDDGQGSGSSNTGFFMHFRQGKIDSSDFSITSPTPNEIVSVQVDNINDTDVWLYEIDTNGIETTQWRKLESMYGNNIVYNNIFNGIKNVYSIATRANDRIDLVFSDGVFGDLPSGSFRTYYRTSNNSSNTVSPSSIGTVNINIPYLSTRGTNETLTLGLKLNYTVSNSSPSESNDEIRKNAPASYYTQNRLITGEDYNVGILSLSQEIIKSKSINRTSSGISKFYDLKDTSGKYSKTTMFADDGILYRDFYNKHNYTTFQTQSDIEGYILSKIEPMLYSSNAKNFYYAKFPRVNIRDRSLTWIWEGYDSATNSGFISIDNQREMLGEFSSGVLEYFEVGAMCKFVPPSGKFFNEHGEIVNERTYGTSEYLWTKILNISEFEQTGGGTLSYLSDVVPNGAILVSIIPVYSRTIADDTKRQIIDRAYAKQDFAIRYDIKARQWAMITSENIDYASDFSLENEGDNSGENLDASWIVKFKINGDRYEITQRNLRYVFESEREIRFFFDGSSRVYEPETGKVVTDSITVLNTNYRRDNDPIPFSDDLYWSVIDSYRDKQDYIDSTKIQIQFSDENRNNSIDDPDLFDAIVADDQIIFHKKSHDPTRVSEFEFYSKPVLVQYGDKEPDPLEFSLSSGDIVYFADHDVFYKYQPEFNPRFTLTTEFKANRGRHSLKFKYVHVADANYRIDPSRSNLIDTYLLTKSYDNAMRKYAKGELSNMPMAPTSDQLFREYNGRISQIKSISDDVIYHPVKYKILFGERASDQLQVTFKIVRNKAIVTNSSELKSNVIRLIDQYFSVQNWDFGETFYFQELSAYVMNNLSPEIVSLIIVPKNPEYSFGSLFEIKSDIDEIFISAAKVSDVEIIDEITASNIQASGPVITSSDNMNLYSNQ